MEKQVTSNHTWKQWVLVNMYLPGVSEVKMLEKVDRRLTDGVIIIATLLAHMNSKALNYIIINHL